MVRPHPPTPTHPLRFPHTRGDGPSFCALLIQRFWFSPHAWGWSDRRGLGALSGRVFPTRVGMVRVVDSLVQRVYCFPHTRGDGPSSRGNIKSAGWFSPHAWGWSGCEFHMASASLVFPTRVGMVRNPRHAPAAINRFPHTRGDGPNIACGSRPDGKFSPHAWGWSGFYQQPDGTWSVFPTRVGMVRQSKPRLSLRQSFPHTRGDGPLIEYYQKNQTAFSPHAWGWSAHRGCKGVGA